MERMSCVDRAVNWVLGEGMAVILDRHWLDSMRWQAAMPDVYNAVRTQNAYNLSFDRA